MPFISTKPPPSPPRSLDDATYLPETTANIYSLITFGWITPLLGLGYARPLEATDLYKLSPDRGASHISDLITDSFLRRVQRAEEYNERLANGEIGPGIKGVWWSITGKRQAKEREWREKTGKKKASLVWAMNDSVKWWFWSGGMLKVVGDVAQVTSPLVVKVCWLSVYVNPASPSFARQSSNLLLNLMLDTEPDKIYRPLV